MLFKAVACRELRLYIKKGTGRGMVVILVLVFGGIIQGGDITWNVTLDSLVNGGF